MRRLCEFISDYMGVLALLATACILTGCFRGCGSSAPEPAPENPEEITPAAPDSVFVSMPIPTEVEARVRGVSYPDHATIPLEDLRYLRLSYVDFEGNPQIGELVCNKRIADDLVDIFRELYKARYPIRSIRLIDDYGGKDEASMAEDNTSCFNYRPKSGGRSLSKHALGLAVDVNPLENPYVRGRTVLPADAGPYVDRGQTFPHKIDKNDLCYKLFRQHGFTWGGSWGPLKDYQHFEK